MTADAAFSEYVGIFEAEQQRKATQAERAELRARLEAGRPPLDSLLLLTVAEYAEREGITTQATYKRIKQGRLRGVTISTGEKKGRCVIVSAAACPPEKEAEEIPAEAVNRQQDDMQQSGPASIGTDAGAELEKLRAENEKLRAQLDEERAAARVQADRILTLAERLADLTAASQVLLQQQQQAGRIAAHIVEYEDAAANDAPPSGEAAAANETAKHGADLDNATQPAENAPPPQERQAAPAEQPKKGLFARLFGV